MDDSAGSAIDAPTDRSTRDVIEAHIARRRGGEVERDIERNFAPDVVVLHANGAVLGHDGVRTSAGRLHEQLPDARFDIRALHVHEEYAYLEWSARSERYAVEDGADSFVVRDGRIVMQTIHYTLEE